MMNTKHILVMGATGQQGSAVVARAVSRGHGVRAFVRDPSSDRAKRLAQDGATLVQGDFDTVESISSACAGADSLFVALPSEEGIEVERARGRRIFECAHTAGISHIVYSSAASADRDIPVPHVAGKHEIEEALKAIGVPWNIVAPVYFLENNGTEFARSSLRRGIVSRFFSIERPIQQVSLADVAAMAVHLCEQAPRLAGRRIELAGDSVSTADVVRMLEPLVGRPLTGVAAPVSLLPSGTPFWESVAALIDWLERDGFQVDIRALHDEFPEIAWTTFASWAESQDWADCRGSTQPAERR